MERIINMHQQNQKIIAGEKIVYNGEEYDIPPMSDEEIAQMKEDGKVIGDISITLEDGTETTLLEIDNGRKLFKRLQVLPLPQNANKNAFWFLWRETRIEEAINKLPDSKAEKIRQILNR